MRVQIENPEQATPGLTILRESTDYTGISASPSIGGSSSDSDIITSPLNLRNPTCGSEEYSAPIRESPGFQRALEESLRDNREILRELAKH